MSVSIVFSKGLAVEEANAIHARIKDMRGRLDALRGYL